MGRRGSLAEPAARGRFAREDVDVHRTRHEHAESSATSVFTGLPSTTMARGPGGVLPIRLRARPARRRNSDNDGGGPSTARASMSSARPNASARAIASRWWLMSSNPTGPIRTGSKISVCGVPLVQDRHFSQTLPARDAPWRPRLLATCSCVSGVGAGEQCGLTRSAAKSPTSAASQYINAPNAKKRVTARAILPAIP